ncbi:GNAT family N-acetyltransferase [Luteibacter yeojuensis]|uniref:GNAT family N-acetyltransferase n=1 Tax=Luteibacter yeojuensis TaxID=345309 RepID=A0A7X5QUL6_9GAMM|nr:GNAT family N-acetyltransferase [Luteibacter yeojuensis]NID15712.1 GNAT family N-acetyltransferase [Luteibacter yeojuensis]
MALAIRDVREHDLDAVLALNNAAGTGILATDLDRLRHLYEIAHYFRVAEQDGRILGFLIAMRQDADYASQNFRWFQAHYESFVYIDRIVIASQSRGHGLGRIFYCDVQSYAEVRVPLLTCEVFLEPRNDQTVLFHGTMGFQEVGQQKMEEGPKVSLLARELPSFPFVRERYLEHGGLPKVEWLAERQRPIDGVGAAA